MPIKLSIGEDITIVLNDGKVLTGFYDGEITVSDSSSAKEAHAIICRVNDNKNIIEDKIEQLCQQKEEAVANQDYEVVADLQARVKHLKQQLKCEKTVVYYYDPRAVVTIVRREATSVKPAILGEG